MQRENVSKELESLAFDFFYWFSRFEFALKESRYLMDHTEGANASPGWNDFVKAWHSKFQLSPAAQELLKLAPKRQVVGPNDELQWRDEDFSGCATELARVVRLLKNTRNNLFHGGKHVAKGWDNPARTKELLSCGKNVLDEFVDMAGFGMSYRGYY